MVIFDLLLDGWFIIEDFFLLLHWIKRGLGGLSM
jgi:hypothetical protein